MSLEENIGALIIIGAMTCMFFIGRNSLRQDLANKVKQRGYLTCRFYGKTGRLIWEPDGTKTTESEWGSGN